MKMKLFVGLLVAFIAVYLSGFSKDVFLFILSLNILLWALFFVLAAGATALLKRGIFKLLPREIAESKSVGLSAVILSAGIAASLVIYAFFRFYAGSSADIQSAPAERIKSLAYLTWSPLEPGSAQKKGVTSYDTALAFKGNNLYNSRNLAKACLMDMSGKTLHTWEAKIDARDSWQDIRLCPDGGLLAVVKDKLLLRLDRDSGVKWYKRMRFHHDIDISEDKKIWTLVWKDEVVFISGMPVPVLNDYILVLSMDGKPEREISLFDALRGEVALDKVFAIYRCIINPGFVKSAIKHKLAGRPVIDEDAYCFDILHANTVAIVDGDIPGLCKKGDILVSLRNLNLVGILDNQEAKLIWKWGRHDLSGQHSPALLKNRDILIFDNGISRGYSRLVEVNPRTNTIVWEYRAEAPYSLYSEGCSSAQRLPNGNTLILNSDKGYAFEITGSGRRVWEFYNPEMDIRSNARATIGSMKRLGEDEF